MKIYMAGVYCNNLGAWPIQNENKACFRDFAYPYHLESYHYIGKTSNGANRIRDRIRDCGANRIFLDSGAFSMFTLGSKVDLPAYADYVKKNADIIEVASVLDAIGDAQKTLENQKELEGLGVEVLPCFHYGEPLRYLEHYLANYPYITLGGMVPIAKPALKKWLDELWRGPLTDADGAPIVKVHGFGMTTFELMLRYPWYSVDSTSYVSGSKLGSILLYMNGKQYSISIAEGMTSGKEIDQHFDTLPEVMQRAIDQHIVERGYSLEALRTSYSLRDHFNIGYYAGLDHLMITHFDKKAPAEQTLF